MRATVINYIFTILFALLAFRNCTLPDYIKVCHHDNPNLGSCINNSIEVLRPRLKAGIPELDVPPLEPLYFDILSFYTSSASQAAHLATNITNVKVSGASNFQILKLIPTLTKKGNTFKFEATIPQLQIEGQYEIDSKILVLELKGKGPFYANISNYHFECIMKGEKVKRDGQEYLEFEKMKCNLVVGKVSVRLENLFNGNALLARATNDAINDNSDAFFEEIKPSLLDAIREKFTYISNKITSSFKYAELFP